MTQDDTINLSNCEQKERYLSNRLFSHIPSIERVEYTSGRITYDAIVFLNNNKKVITEVKVRDCFIKTYPNYILQEDKLINLIKHKVKNNCDFIYYINYFKNPDNDNLMDCIVFDIGTRVIKWKNNKPEIKLMWMNEETYVNNPHKVQKRIILLYYDEKMDMKVTFSIN